jgi:single-stranded-DNA-specific exonuclease
VLVFGDFDADGLTGLAIMVQAALERYGLTAEPYVPSRLDEGHGLSIAALDRAQRSGRRSSRSIAEATSHAESQAAGADSTSSSPTTIASRRSCRRRPSRSSTRTGRTRYPDRRLAGAASPSRSPGAPPADLPGGPAAASPCRPRDHRDRRGRGADRRENRAHRPPRTRDPPYRARPGIAAILERANVAPAAVDLETVSFAIAPRLNAAGRVGEAVEAARLPAGDHGRGREPPRGRAQAANREAVRPAQERRWSRREPRST